MENLESVLQRVWRKKTKERFIPLNSPTIDHKTKTAEINLLSKEIIISERFAYQLEKEGVPYEDSLDALLEHEIGHYFYMPRSLYIQLLQIAALKSAASKDKVDSIINYFNDVSDNTNIILKGGETSKNLASIYRNLKEDKETKIGALLRAYYHSLNPNLNFGKTEDDLDILLKSKLEALNGIDFAFRDERSITSNLNFFYTVVKDLIPDQHNKSDENGTGLLDNISSSITNASKGEIEDALGKLVNIIDKDDYGYLYNLLKDKIEESSKNPSKGFSHTHSDSYGWFPDPTSISYYQNKARSYPIKILGRPLNNKNYVKQRLSEWNPSDGVRNMNLNRSGGRIIPGITKKWESGEYTTYSNSIKKIPDLLLVIDSSGSMDNPQTSDSYAAIAGCSIALEYIKNRSKVDVINFSYESITTKYGSQRQTLTAILTYQGGSTNFPSKEVKDLLKEKPEDLVVITDGEVDEQHLENFFDTVNEAGKSNRMSFVYIGQSPENVNFFTEKYTNIKFHFVNDLGDIPKIVLGDFNY